VSYRRAESHVGKVEC